MVNEQQSSIDICILIPCYNNTEGLVKSINSIVYHPKRFVVVVVDDGSKPAISKKILQQQVTVEVKLELLRLSRNLGITQALNKGLECIYVDYNATFIARLDCGDTCAPKRFFSQVDFLTRNPGISLLGTWCYFRNSRTGKSYKYITPTQHKSIENSMYFRNVFIHPSVMWRVSLLGALKYPGNYPHAEDYGLFYDIVARKQTAIIDDFLITCEINPHGISFVNRFAQLRSRLRVICHYGTVKWKIAAGVSKLLLLMVVPYKLVYTIKSWLFKA